MMILCHTFEVVVKSVWLRTLGCSAEQFKDLTHFWPMLFTPWKQRLIITSSSCLPSYFYKFVFSFFWAKMTIMWPAIFTLVICKDVSAINHVFPNMQVFKRMTTLRYLSQCHKIKKIVKKSENYGKIWVQANVTRSQWRRNVGCFSPCFETEHFFQNRNDFCYIKTILIFPECKCISLMTGQWKTSY